MEDQMMMIFKIIFFIISGIGLGSCMFMIVKIAFEKEKSHGRKER